MPLTMPCPKRSDGFPPVGVKECGFGGGRSHSNVFRLPLEHPHTTCTAPKISHKRVHVHIMVRVCVHACVRACVRACEILRQCMCRGMMRGGARIHTYTHAYARAQAEMHSKVCGSSESNPQSRHTCFRVCHLCFSACHLLKVKVGLECVAGLSTSV